MLGNAFFAAVVIVKLVFYNVCYGQTESFYKRVVLLPDYDDDNPENYVRSLGSSAMFLAQPVFRCNQLPSMEWRLRNATDAVIFRSGFFRPCNDHSTVVPGLSDYPYQLRNIDCGCPESYFNMSLFIPNLTQAENNVVAYLHFNSRVFSNASDLLNAAYCLNSNDGVVMDDPAQCGYSCIADFSCDTGFKNATGSSYCGPYAKFETWFNCSRETCNVTNLTVNYPETTSNATELVESEDVVLLECSPGYHGNSATFRCNSNGMFDYDTPPLCEKKHPFPPWAIALIVVVIVAIVVIVVIAWYRLICKPGSDKAVSPKGNQSADEI